MRTCIVLFVFFSSRRRHTRLQGDWSSDVCSSDLAPPRAAPRSAGSAAIVLGVALAGAVLLRQFLLAESWITVLALLACFAVALVAVQKRPLVEDRIVAAFGQCRPLDRKSTRLNSSHLVISY